MLEEADNISDNCFKSGKNLGSLGVNRLKKEFFIHVYIKSFLNTWLLNESLLSLFPCF